MIDYKNSILVACERSQIVTNAFRSAGYNAYSCDIVPGFIDQSYHLLGDVNKWINCPWKMIIAFPPCTYVSVAGDQHLLDHDGKIKDPIRFKKGFYAKDFFLKFYHNKCNLIAIENPKNLKIFGYPKNEYYWNPCEFGHNYSKKSYFWLKNLPPLMPSFINLDYKSNSVNYLSSDNRSIFHPLVAKAMVEQWGPIFDAF